ncbi:glycosyltransferase [Acinetobacter sp. YH12027]|uniref:glycosyltransferase n=1 Tax=Acinetobacter sp. YH12027 TaxID=2601043 RepID=UPI0015D1E41E|nr:glycosyltransferase [Acinetobacter sp. YH12027]
MNILNSPTTISQSNIFPKYPENFGMVAIEAAAHGTPTVTFATDGIVDAVQHGKTGFLIKKQDYQALTQTNLEFLKGNLLIDKTLCSNAAKQFAWALLHKYVSI